MTGAKAKRARGLRPDSSQAVPASPPSNRRWKPWLWLLGLAVIFLFIEYWVPLATSIKLGTDEDFELSKVLLYLKGYHLYSEVWDDQPPLYTWLLAHLVRPYSLAILPARLLTVGLTLLLLGSFFRLIVNLGNLRTAVGATALLIAAPGFLELASSCMVEIPTVSFVLAALAWLSRPGAHRWPWREIGAGALFGVALQIKGIALVYGPLLVLLLWLKYRPPFKQLILSTAVIGLTSVAAFISLNALTGYGLGLQLQQAWASHFAGTRSFEYGSPAEHVFDLKLLFKNWDVMVPVLAGVGFLITQIRSKPLTIFPLAWLVLTATVISTHRPWWGCYYLHNAIPLCWCAAMVLDAAFDWAGSRKVRTILLAAYLMAAGLWMGIRSYLEVAAMRHSPQVFNSLVLSEINRYKPFTKYMFATEEIYTFHAGIPMPPSLAQITLKRFWSGDLTNEKLADELAAIKPGVILTGNQVGELPYSALLQRDYRLVYQDNEHQLYALKTISRLANQ